MAHRRISALLPPSESSAARFMSTPDPPHPIVLLCSRRQRPRSGGAAEQRGILRA